MQSLLEKFCFDIFQPENFSEIIFWKFFFTTFFIFFFWWKTEKISRRKVLIKKFLDNDLLALKGGKLPVG